MAHNWWLFHTAASSLCTPPGHTDTLPPSFRDPSHPPPSLPATLLSYLLPSSLCLYSDIKVYNIFNMIYLLKLGCLNHVASTKVVQSKLAENIVYKVKVTLVGWKPLNISWILWLSKENQNKCPCVQSAKPSWPCPVDQKNPAETL